MSNRTVEHLRDHLFGQLDRLADTSLTGEKLKEEIERAKVVQATAGRIIDTAKAQTDRMRLLESQPNDNFLEGEAVKPRLGSGR